MPDINIPDKKDIGAAFGQFIRRHAVLRRCIILTWHIIGICLAYYIAFFLRFEGSIPTGAATLCFKTLPALLFINLVIFFMFRLHSSMWSFFSLDDLIRVLAALVTATMVFVAYVFIIQNFSFIGYPRSVFMVYFLLMATWTAGGRLIIRWLREHRERQMAPVGSKRALVVGTLDDVENVLHGLKGTDESINQFVGVLTDEASAHHLTIRGVRIYGAVAEVGKTARKTNANCILILPPYTRPKQIDQIIDDCQKEGVTCEFQMIPSLSELASGRIELSSIRKVELEDLLGRPEISFNRQTVREMITKKVVMITGAGGSIGSELTCQIAHYAPKRLVLFDISEFNLFSIDEELRRSLPQVQFVPVAGDIGHNEQVAMTLKQYGVQVIFHAAAYKHVPLMEDNVAACILNNTVGTARLVDQAERSGVEHFVLISSDKAIRPTSVMGASKRLAERIIQERPVSKTCFVTVRFGNVLGSSGSVIPLFQKQIAGGGPVTVTTPNMLRFFMSIPEAVDLLLQASVIGHDRDIMVLEMGQSIKVLDMAKRLIELSGLRVGEDIEIVFTGMRPGEKEYEELMTDNENIIRTPFEKIWVMQKTAADQAPPIDLDLLTRLALTHDEVTMRKELARLIPDAHRTILRTKKTL